MRRGRRRRSHQQQREREKGKEGIVRRSQGRKQDRKRVFFQLGAKKKVPSSSVINETYVKGAQIRVRTQEFLRVLGEADKLSQLRKMFVFGTREEAKGFFPPSVKNTTIW